MDDRMRCLCLCRHPPFRHDQRQIHRLFRPRLFRHYLAAVRLAVCRARQHALRAGQRDSERGYQDWHLWFLAFPYLYIGHIVLLAFNTIRLLLPPYPPRFVHYAALLLTLLSGWHVGAFMPTA